MDHHRAEGPGKGAVRNQSAPLGEGGFLCQRSKPTGVRHHSPQKRGQPWFQHTWRPGDLLHCGAAFPQLFFCLHAITLSCRRAATASSTSWVRGERTGSAVSTGPHLRTGTRSGARPGRSARSSRDPPFLPAGGSGDRTEETLRSFEWVIEYLWGLPPNTPGQERPHRSRRASRRRFSD